jgi:hypothetical protein
MGVSKDKWSIQSKIKKQLMEASSLYAVLTWTRLFALKILSW